jgi:bacterioferritin
MSDLRPKLVRLAHSLPAKSEKRRLLLSILRKPKQGLELESNPVIIETLDGLLRREMTVVNQYMVQHALCANWGYNVLAGLLKAQAIGEMKHAEMLIERVIFLEGIPEVGQLNKVHVGADVPTQLKNNWTAEREAVDLYNQAIAMCYTVGDNGTRKMLEPILDDEEQHLDHTQALLEQIKAMGLPNFLAEMTDD